MPTLAVAKALKRQNNKIEIVFVGSKLGIESKIISRVGIKFYGISTGKFRRYSSSKIVNIINPMTLFKNLLDFFRFLKGIIESIDILNHEKPDVVFAKGGFVSLPVAIAARLKKIPIVAHESDVVMGLANKKISGFANKVCVSFPKEKYQNYVSEEKIVETGNPVREDIFMGNGEEYLREIGFSPKKKTILVIGGSQGSQFINSLILDILIDILKKWQLVWVTGERDYDLINYKTEELPEKIRKNLKIYSFVSSDLSKIYAAADLVVSRAGSNVLFEMAALAKPTIIIPIAQSANSHQIENAKVFSRKGGAYLMLQEKTTAAKLLHQIEYLLNNEEELRLMSQKINTMANVGAADTIAKIIIEEAKRIEKDREATSKES